MKIKRAFLLFLIICLVSIPLSSSKVESKQYFIEIFNQGENYRLAGNYDKSIEFFKKCLAIARKTGFQKEEMDSIIKLAILSWNIGELKDSTNYYLRASLIAKSIGSKKIEENCQKAVQIYELYLEGKDYRDNVGDYEKSIDCFKAAINLSKEIKSPEHELKCLRQTSINFLELNALQDYYELNIKALSLAQKIKSQKDEGICFNNIGLYYWKIENYSAALKYYEKALDIAQTIDNLKSKADVLTNESLLYADLGNFEKSIELLLKVLEIDQQTGLSDKIPLDMNNIGITYRRKALLTNNNNDFIIALRYFEDCLNLARKNSNIKTEIKALNNIGSVYSEQNKNDEALKYFDSAYKKAEKIADIEEMSIILNNIGIVHYSSDNYEQSISYCQKAIDLALEIKDGQILWEPFLGIGNAYKKQKKYIEAKEKYENSISIIEGARSTIELEELKASYIGTNKRIEPYHNLIDLLVNLNKSAPHKGYEVEAFNYLEKAKARAFLDSLEVSEISISQRIDFRLSNQKAQLDSEISKLYNKLLASESTPEQRNEINQKIKDCEDQLVKLKMKIRRINPAYADLNPQIITLKEVQEQLLDGKTAFFAYSIGKDSSYGFAISKRGLKIFPISPRSKIQKRVTEYLKAISDKDNNDFHLGYELFSELVLPGLDDKIQKLVFSPDDILYLLPFEALLTQKNNNQWLINHHTVAYAPSISSLREIIKRSKNNSKKRGKDLLAFGDPLYGDAELENGSKKNADIFQNFYPSQEFKFFRLKYSGIEVQKIASLFKATKEEVYQKEEASEAELKSLKLDNYKIIHFAVHGLIDDQKPTRSSIVLSLNQDSQEDGFVQMREIYNLRMNSDLVTLSACQTGLGQFIRGEGIEGLSRAFFYAGASSVLMSLWAVNDQASYQLMERFYFHLRASGSIMEALQKAKLEMIHSRVFSHPYYWAGFVITGNAAKVIFPRNLTKWIPVIISLCVGSTLFVGFRNLKKKKIRLAVAKMCYRVSHD